MLNFDSKVPLYHQLYEIMLGQIRRGDWQPGDLIPPESELVEQYNISRGTVRQALDALVSDGLIHRERGRGTFVAHPTIQQVAGQMITFAEDMRQRGFRPSTEVLFSGLVPAPEYIAARLRLAPGDELARIDRLRLADGEPMSIEESYLVHRLCPGVLEGRDYATDSLRAALESVYGIYQMRGEQVVRAMLAPPDMAGKLAIPADKSAVLFIERVSYSQHGTPVEFLRLYHRGDRYALRNDLVGWRPEGK